MKSEAPLSRGPVREDLSETVIRIIAEVTRYPRNILTPEALLEDELGIESVKRAEILTVLSSKLGFTMPTEGNGNHIKSIGDVVAAVERMMSGAPAPAAAPAAPAAAPAPISPISRPAPPVVTQAAPPPAPRAPVVEAYSTPREREPVQAYREAPREAPRETPREPVRERKLTSSIGRERESLPLAGKLAFVAGSGHGIGREISQHLFRQGASVILNSFHSREEGDRAAADLLEQGAADEVKGRTVTHLWGSVANSEHLEAMFGELQSQFGHLDFLVSAASNAPHVPVDQIQPEDWERAFRTEVVGLHQMALKAIPLMQARGGGRIVAVTHPAAHRVFPGSACGGTVKAAVESLVRYLAVQLGGKGILVNALCAGPFARDIETHPERDAIMAQWRERSPGGRLPDSKGVAAAMALLLSPEAAMMSGSTLVLDGGLSLAL